jgi:hypothetical protein
MNRRLIQTTLIAFVFALLYTAEGIVYRDYNLDEFQVATGYLKDREPGLFSSDFIWSKDVMIRNLHLCVRALMDFTDWITFRSLEEPIDLFLIWLPLAFILFFLGNYLLAYEFSRHHAGSILVACIFSLIHRTVYDWWGIGPTLTMSARGIVVAILPLALWSFHRLPAKRLKPLFVWALALGFMSNFHPLSGWAFAGFMGISFLVRERFSGFGWGGFSLIAAGSLLGSIPFMMVWRDVAFVGADEAASLETYNLLQRYYEFMQPSFWKYFQSMMGDMLVPLGLVILGAWSYRRSSRHTMPELQRQGLRLQTIFLVLFLLHWVVLVFGGEFLKRMGVVFPVFVSEEIRNLKLIYLVFPAWMGIAFAYWFRRMEVGSRSKWLVWGVPIMVTVAGMMINFPGHKLARWALYQAGWLPERSAVKVHGKLESDKSDLALAGWARRETPPDSLFYFDSYEFRYYARRSLVYCHFDRPCVAFRPSREGGEWLERDAIIAPLKKARDTSGMSQAALRYGADYLVTLREWPGLGFPIAWEDPKYIVYALNSNIVSNP